MEQGTRGNLGTYWEIGEQRTDVCGNRRPLNHFRYCPVMWDRQSKKVNETWLWDQSWHNVVLDEETGELRLSAAKQNVHADHGTRLFDSHYVDESTPEGATTDMTTFEYCEAYLPGTLKTGRPLIYTRKTHFHKITLLWDVTKPVTEQKSPNREYARILQRPRKEAVLTHGPMEHVRILQRPREKAVLFRTHGPMEHVRILQRPREKAVLTHGPHHIRVDVGPTT